MRVFARSRLRAFRIETGFAVSLLLAVLLLLGSCACGCSGSGELSSVTEPMRAEETDESDGAFGVLVGRIYPGLSDCLQSVGVSWVRPHPGPCIWDRMQPSAGAEIDFEGMDALVGWADDTGLNLVITVWPYADWDQETGRDAERYRAPPGDGFADVLPDYRGNPCDWEAYSSWLSAVVERYDGDGSEDMPGLKRPVKHWEISNEPEFSEGGGPARFYAGGPGEYAELLVSSYRLIKSADDGSAVLVAGAAGSQPGFLDYWLEVFESGEARDSFDIGNVHCISSGSWQDLNVSRYLEMLSQAGIDRPVWVTEAEAVSGNDLATNEAGLQEAVRGALDAGAEKIFFTTRSMSGRKRSGGGNVLLVEQDSYRRIIDEFERSSR